jgi:hypothetical protein
MREKEAGRLYLVELFGSLAIYGVILTAAIHYAPAVTDKAARAALMVSPMLGFCLAVWAVVRQFGRMDEYQHLRSLEAISIAAAVTAGWTFTYGFLELAGFPKLSMFTIWPVMGAVWGGVVCIRRLLGR